MTDTFIIAEACSNILRHDYDLFCRAVAGSDANAVKIQVYRAEHFPASEWADKFRTEFPRERIREFARAAWFCRLKAGASVFDQEAVSICAQEMDFLKLAAREQDNHRLNQAVAQTGKRFFRSISRRASLYNYWSVSRCTTLWAVPQYPTPLAIALWNLAHWSAFCFVKKLDWGWSSHTRTGLDCVLAVRLGASVIEKHFALGRADPEAGHSLMPDDFAKMVRQIRNVH